MAGAAPTTTVDLAQAMILKAPALAEWLVIAPTALSLLCGAVLTMLRKSVRLHAPIAIATLALVVLVDLALVLHVSTQGPVTMVMGRWLPPFGIAFTADLLGALFALTGAIVALACALYGAADIDATGRRYGFYPFLMLLIGGVSGAFLTGDIFNLYVWFEVLLIASFGLLVLGSERGQIDGATKYAFLNLVATTLFLVATGYLYGLFGTLNMADIAIKARASGATMPLMTLATLYLVAFAMKAAAFPANAWLPASYHTPRIVVSALFAGLLTKVGVYALLRTLVMLFPAEGGRLSFIIALVAAGTMLVGVLGALAQTDIRRLIGYLVISGIGTMLAGLALTSHAGLAGTVVYAIHSMLVMTALYLAAGLAIRAAGSASLTDLGGLYRTSPWLAAMSLVLFFAVAGLPPLSGVWPKIMLVKASLDTGAWWLAATILVTGFLTTIAVGRVWVLAFWRPSMVAAPAGTAAMAGIAIGGHDVHAVGAGTDTARPRLPAVMLFALAGLTALSILIGVLPDTVIRAGVAAASGLLEPSAYLQSVFPGGAP